jgi:hypothetical protein
MANWLSGMACVVVIERAQYLTVPILDARLAAVDSKFAALSARFEKLNTRLVYATVTIIAVVFGNGPYGDAVLNALKHLL